MAKFKCYHRTSEGNSGRNCFAEATSKQDAINACKRKISELSATRETNTMVEALELRGFYCIGWSSNILEIEEVE